MPEALKSPSMRNQKLPTFGEYVLHWQAEATLPIAASNKPAYVLQWRKHTTLAVRVETAEFCPCRLMRIYRQKEPHRKIPVIIYEPRNLYLLRKKRRERRENREAGSTPVSRGTAIPRTGRSHVLAGSRIGAATLFE